MKYNLASDYYLIGDCFILSNTKQRIPGTIATHLGSYQLARQYSSKCMARFVLPDPSSNHPFKLLYTTGEILKKFPCFFKL
jgi:hypothetical protein